MAVGSVISIAILAMSVMWIAEARIPGVYTGGAWQSAHATFYGGADASGTMGMSLCFPAFTLIVPFLRKYL